MNKKYIAILSSIGFSVIFGLSFMFSKIALEYINPIELITYRFTIAFLVINLLRVIGVVKISLNGKNIKILLITAIFQPILYFIFETIGLSYTASNEAGMMIALIPIFVTLLSALFLNEKPRPIQIPFIFISVIGVFYINYMKDTSGLNANTIGVVLLLGAVISAAIFNLLSRKASKSFKPIETTYVMMALGTISFNAILVVMKINDNTLLQYFNPLFNFKVFYPLLYLGIIASIGGFFLVNFSLSRMNAHESAIFANVATIISIIAGTVFLNENLYSFHIIGSILILTGVYGTVRFSKKNV